MSCVIDLYQWRHASRFLSHPAGVTLPIGKAGDADLFIPQVRNAIAGGHYCADVINALPVAVPRGARALVVGSGLGLLSTLIAKIPGVARVIVIEPNITVADYIGQVHEANGVARVEILNGIPVEDGCGRIPLFVRHDVRASSLVPDDGPWRQVMLVPGVDLDLILAEEQTSLIVAENGAGTAPVLAQADLGAVDRIVLGAIDVPGRSRENEALASSLSAAGFAAEGVGAATTFRRALVDCGHLHRRAASF